MYAAPGRFLAFCRADSRSALVVMVAQNQSRQPMVSGSLWYCHGASLSYSWTLFGSSLPCTFSSTPKMPLLSSRIMRFTPYRPIAPIWPAVHCWPPSPWTNMTRREGSARALRQESGGQVAGGGADIHEQNVARLQELLYSRKDRSISDRIARWSRCGNSGGPGNEGVLNLGASLARATKRSFMWTGPKVAGPRPPSSTTSFISTWSGHTLSILEA